VRNSPSFQRSIEHCSYVVDLHLWQKADQPTFATFVYEKAGSRLLRHFANSDETEAIRKALVWCEHHAAEPPNYSEFSRNFRMVSDAERARYSPEIFSIDAVPPKGAHSLAVRPPN
jgi:hypothetical protein